jgi:hypothetical protein
LIEDDMKKLLFLLMFVGFVFPLLSSDTRSRIAVMEFTDETGFVDDKVLLAASQYMRSLFVGSNKYIVISRERQQNEMVKVMRKESHQICRDRSCQIPLGQSLSADTILVSTISRFGGKYILTVELIDLAKEATVRGATADFDGKEEGLRNAVDDVVAQVFGVRRAIPATAPQKTASVQTVPVGSSAQDEQACNFARRENTVEMWERYLSEFPGGACAFEANIFFEREEELRKQEEERQRKIAEEKRRQEELRQKQEEERQRKIAEEKRRQEELRQKQEEERQRKIAEAKRIEEEERIRKEKYKTVRPLAWLGWTGLGLGAASIAVGIGMNAKMKSDLDKSADWCSYISKSENYYNSAKSARIARNVFYGVGIGLAVVGIPMFFIKKEVLRENPVSLYFDDKGFMIAYELKF